MVIHKRYQEDPVVDAKLSKVIFGGERMVECGLGSRWRCRAGAQAAHHRE